MECKKYVQFTENSEYDSLQEKKQYQEQYFFGA